MNSLTDIFRILQEKYPGFGKSVRQAEALGRWDECVGEGIAKRTRPIKVQDQILWVEVDHPVWKNELVFRKRQILDRLNSKAEKGEALLTDIYFVDPGRTY